MSTISLLIAQQTEIWEIQRGDTPEELGYNDIELQAISIDEIERRIREQKAQDVELQPYVDIFIYYEDFFNRPLEATQAAIDDLLQQIGGLGNQPGSYLDYLIKRMALVHFNPDRKQNKPHIFERIPNWEEIREYFKLD